MLGGESDQHSLGSQFPQFLTGQRNLRQMVPAGKSAQMAQENQQSAASLVARLEQGDLPAFEIAQYQFWSRLADFHLSPLHCARIVAFAGSYLLCLA